MIVSMKTAEFLEGLSTATLKRVSKVLREEASEQTGVLLTTPARDRAARQQVDDRLEDLLAHRGMIDAILLKRGELRVSRGGGIFKGGL